MPLPKESGVSKKSGPPPSSSSDAPEPSQDGRTSEIDWQTMRYDSRTKVIYVEEIEVDVSYCVGLAAQVLSEALSSGWKVLIDGFRNNWELFFGGGEMNDPKKQQREESDDIYIGGGKDGKGKVPLCATGDYVRMWITCDEEVYMARLGIIVAKVKKLLNVLERRDMGFVSAGAAKGKVDDMLEYSVRLATGTGVVQDQKIALRTLRKIVKGQFSKDKIAIAYNMLCYLHKKRFTREGTLENLVATLLFADLAASSGPITHCISTFAHNLSPLMDQQPYNSFPALWTKYEEYKEKWGLIDPLQSVCVVCGAKPRRRRKLKRCAGYCFVSKKPRYCGTNCQRKHWPTHKRWCRKDPAPTESDLESAIYYEDDYFVPNNGGGRDSGNEKGNPCASDGEGEAEGRQPSGPLLERLRLDNSDDDDDSDNEEWFSCEEATDGSLYDDDDNDDRKLASKSKPSDDQAFEREREIRHNHDNVLYLEFVVYLAMSVIRSKNAYRIVG